MVASQTLQMYTLDLQCGKGYHVNQLNELANTQNNLEIQERKQSGQPYRLPRGWKLYLQLFTKDKQLLDWIYLGKSNFANIALVSLLQRTFQNVEL
jgi:hypothetical protein